MTTAIFGLAAVIFAAALGLAGVLRTAKPAEHTADVEGLTALLDQMRAERAEDRQTVKDLRAEVTRLHAEISRLKATIVGLRASLAGREPPDDGAHP